MSVRPQGEHTLPVAGGDQRAVERDARRAEVVVAALHLGHGLQRLVQEDQPAVPGDRRGQAGPGPIR